MIKQFTYKILISIGVFLLANQAEAQVCLSTPADLTWDCGDEDWEYVYSVGSDVIAHQCIDVDSVLDQTISLQIDIQDLGVMMYQLQTWFAYYKDVYNCCTRSIFCLW